MKKLLYPLIAALMLITSGCKYDDSDLWNSVNNLEQRVTSLEELCKQMNTNVTSLQTIVNVINENDYITQITPLYEGGTQIGYTIEFANSPSITIYHGQQGDTPIIGVRKDMDGHYYWTLNGNWLLDENGNKVSAEGKSGSDGSDGNDGSDGSNGESGVVPQFKIENGNWYISLDKGQTWIYLGSATGSDGNDGNSGNNGNNGQDGDSIFKSIDTTNENFVIFILADGTEIRVPRHLDFSITFEGECLDAMLPNSTREIPYVISGNTGNLQVEVLSSGNVRAKISDSTSATGILTVTTGTTIDEYDKVVLLVSNGQNTIMRSISFEEAGLKVHGELAYEVGAEGGTIEINIETNTKYSVSIPQDAQNWLSQITPTRSWRQETITLKVESNSTNARKAFITLQDATGYVFSTISISQKSVTGESYLVIPQNMEQAFPDSKFREYILENFDTDNDGRISIDEAEKVEQISFSNRQDIYSIKGIEYFRNLVTLTAYYTNITSIDVSNNLNLVSLDCSYNQISKLDLSKNIKLERLYCYGYELTELDVSQNKDLKQLITQFNPIKILDLSNNIKLEELYCSDNQLSTLDLSNNVNLRALGCDGNMLKTLDVSNTVIGNSTVYYPLTCGNMPTLSTLILKNGWSIRGITEDNNRDTQYIPDNTQIIFVD